jgi:hypothetical protein
MTLLIRHPRSCPAERHYIYETILANFLGLEWQGIAEERRDVCITLQGDASARELQIADVLLRLGPDEWLQQASLPQEPLSVWDTGDLPPSSARRSAAPIPIIFGRAGCTLQADCIRIAADLFGSSFFLMSRYEEAVVSQRDRHDRFPAAAALAVRAGFVDRPLVDEYVEILWAALTHLWPNLARRQRQFRMLVTCDVDRPLTCWAGSAVHTVRKMARDCIKERSPRLAARSFALYLDQRAGRYHKDPFHTFDWIFEECERAGLQATFNFICARTNAAFDGCYDLHDPPIRNLLRAIHARGHEIGMHGSYNSYLDGDQLAREATLLRRAMERENIRQEPLGARQHYLRWRSPDTARHLERAGIAYDSTLAFAERAGFRCGTCFEYQLFDVVERRALRLRERPLILMEGSVLSPQYMGIEQPQRALQIMSDLKNTCRRFGGDFVLLWHNNHLASGYERELYRALLTN